MLFSLFGWLIGRLARSRTVQLLVGAFLGLLLLSATIDSVTRSAGWMAGMVLSLAAFALIVWAILWRASSITGIPARWCASMLLPPLVFLGSHIPGSPVPAQVAGAEAAVPAVPAVPGAIPTVPSPDWQGWALSVLTGLSAPAAPTNLDSLARWTRAEKPAGEPTQWNNPLNTTQWEPGATSMNSVGVEAYPSLAVGCKATLATIENGRYPAIVAALRSSSPSATWNFEARHELSVWGTGSAWVDQA